MKVTSRRIRAACLAIAAMSPVSLVVADTPVTPTLISKSAPSSTQPAVVISTNISEAEVLNAQRAWGDALVAISTTYEQKGKAAAKQLAGQIIDQAYGYQFGTVLFKPTLTSTPQTFRTTRAGALAYFVGDDPAYPNDTGFALKGWRKVEVQNASIFIDSDSAISMGNVIFTDKSGNITTVDKTWGYRKDANGTLRIVLHHSSLPYSNK